MPSVRSSSMRRKELHSKKAVFIKARFFPAKGGPSNASVCTVVPSHESYAIPRFPAVVAILGRRHRIQDCFVSVALHEDAGSDRLFLVFFTYVHGAQPNEALEHVLPGIRWPGQMIVMRVGIDNLVVGMRDAADTELATVAARRPWFQLSQAVMRAPHSSTISTATERARPYPTPYRPELRREEDDMPIHRLLFPLDKSLDRRRSYCAVTRFDAFAEGGSEPFTIPPAPPSPSSSSAESLYESASAESPEKAVDEHEPEHIRQEEQVAEIQAQEEQASGSGVDLAPKTPLGDT
ncbi:hypothetical protein BV25DRAFT_1912120 [Artomyces pyxidatus]|uniref:Uncharacterized protein n=1 Tax=Artomyces pyxidatus TaxID=48021 RepID=A0ACB8TGC0_9AGAM|nr:hypothetical protein BV25DRAFT_1912120 [Artomyces pyxidatus]